MFLTVQVYLVAVNFNQVATIGSRAFEGTGLYYVGTERPLTCSEWQSLEEEVVQVVPSNMHSFIDVYSTDTERQCSSGENWLLNAEGRSKRVNCGHAWECRYLSLSMTLQRSATLTFSRHQVQTVG